MKMKSMKELLEEADRVLGQTKTAAPVVKDEVSSLADTLAFATEIENELAGIEPATPEFEKVAKEINRVAAQVELEVMMQADRFCEAAIKEGYSEDQISEALSKVAAKKIRKHLSSLTAIGALAPSQEDLNTLAKKHVKEVGEEKRQLAAAHSLGGAR